MTLIEDRIREVGTDVSMYTPITDIVQRGRRIRRTRRLRIGGTIVATAAAVSLLPAGLATLAAQHGQSMASQIPADVPEGWSTQAVSISQEELTAADTVCRSAGDLKSATMGPMAATSLGDGVSLLIYRVGSSVWSCVASGGAAGSGGGPELSNAPLSESTPLADTSSTTVSSAQLAVPSSTGHTKYPGYYLVWGRVAEEAKAVVVDVDAERATAGMADGLYFALLPTTIDFNARITPVPSVTATAYDESGHLLGRDTQEW